MSALLQLSLGPWVAREGMIFAQDGHMVARVQRGPLDPDTVMANGRVLAAAWEMLEMLELAHSIEHSVTQGQERELRKGYREKLAALLSKARGR